MNIVLGSLAGGALIGASAAGLILVNGRVAGISGILAEAASRPPAPWRWAFLAGLVGAGAAARLAGFATPAALAAQGWVVLAVSGLLVGFGTRLGAGCTSGHGVCGLANLSPRSLAAVATFMATAALTVLVVRHGGPALGFAALGGTP